MISPRAPQLADDAAEGRSVPPLPIGLHEGRLRVLANPIALDGRVTWYPDHVRGFTSVNCYVISEGSITLLIDSGVTVHRDAVIAQLGQCTSGEPLSIVHTRIGEYPAICNTTAIAEEIAVEGLYAGFPDAIGWVEFRPRAERRQSDHPWAIGHAPESRLIPREEPGLPIGRQGRHLHAIPTPLRLLPSQWFYDDGSHTLFTGDAFTHAWRESAAGPWIADDAGPGTTTQEVLEHLLMRCWWLTDAKRHIEIQRALESVFKRYTVETIAPGYGCIIHGPTAVERHYNMMQAAIEQLARGTRR